MKRILVSAAASALALGLAGVAAAQVAMTEVDVRAALTEAGYTNIHDIEFDDGAWKAEATSGDGNRVDLRIDQHSGQIYAETQVSQLTEQDVKAAVTAAGFRNVHDVDYDDGVWKAEADDHNGDDVELTVDPIDGRIIALEDD